MFSLQKTDHPLTAKIVKQHRAMAEEKRMVERAPGGYPKSTQLIMDHAYNPDQLQMLKEQGKYGSVHEKERMSRHQKRREKPLGPEPVLNLMNKLSGIKKPTTDRLSERPSSHLMEE